MKNPYLMEYPYEKPYLMEYPYEKPIFNGISLWKTHI